MSKGIVGEVTRAVKECSGIIANYTAEKFQVDSYSKYRKLKIESPIEQILYSSLNLFQLIYNCEPEYIEIGNERFVSGIDIRAQYQIGKYRVDFEIRDSGYPFHNKNRVYEQEIKEIIVECDSQEFHERSEKERRYEKQRDRFFISN